MNIYTKQNLAVYLLSGGLAAFQIGCRTANERDTATDGLGLKNSVTRTNPLNTTVESFLNQYFDRWSSRDLKGYKKLFDPSARCSKLQDGQVFSLDLDSFIARQQAFFEKNKEPTIEKMLRSKIWQDHCGASVEVRWRYEGGGEIDEGIDRFTLIRTPLGEWRILHLLWY